jgi:hypothetical protein
MNADPTRRVAVSTDRKMGPINRRLLALCTFSIWATATSALAEDGKTFPGAMCQPVPSTLVVARDRFTGGISNLTRGTRFFICPIVRDNMNANTGEFAAMTVSDFRVRCTLETRSDRGTSEVSISPDSPITGTQGTVRLQFKLGDANFNGAKKGHYYFVCLVPPSETIFSYYVEEDPITDADPE